jgi:DNA-binding transcriptional LysR family regulator
MKNLHVGLNGLRAVEAVARLGGLAPAATELGVTVGAVSQLVLKCEAQLGRAVFERTSRGIVPNAFGKALLPQLASGFQTIDAAIGLARRHADQVLTISVAPVFASKWLVPRLAAWSRRHPEVTVRLDASVGLVDLDASDVDLAIRVGDGQWPGVRAEFLLGQEVFPVSAPAVAARLKAPRDLYRARIVRDANSTLTWDMWLGPLGLDAGRLADGDSFTDASLALDAAIAGQGVLLAWPTLAADALRAGTLVAPFPERAATGIGYWLVTSRTRREPKTVRDFKAWIREAMRETEAMFVPTVKILGN